MFGCPQRPGEDTEFPRAGVAGNCEPISMCAGNQISPLQEQPASTLTVELSLSRPLKLFLLFACLLLVLFLDMSNNFGQILDIQEALAILL